MTKLSLKNQLDTTPATHGDLEIWGGRLMEVIQETSEETKKELRAEMQGLKKELSDRLGDHEQLLKSMKEELVQLKDVVYDMAISVKAIEKKVSKK